MRHTNVMNKDEETNQAAREAMKGAVYGTVKWGAAVGVLCGVGYAVSPLFRSFTIQFKTYIAMSGIAFGAALEAENRMSAYRNMMRLQHKAARDAAMQKALDDQYGPEED